MVSAFVRSRISRHYWGQGVTQIVDRRLNRSSEPVDRGRVVGGDRGGGARWGVQGLGGVQLTAGIEVDLGDVSLKYVFQSEKV